MNAKTTLVSIAILVSTLFITSATPQLLSLSAVMLILCFYCRVPTLINLIFISLIGSLLLENKAIYEANMLFTQTVDRNEQLWNKSVSDHIITAEVITLVNNKNGLHFNVKVNQIDNIDIGLFKPILRVRWLGYTNDYPGLPQLGQVWRFRVKLYSISGSENQAGFFNYAHYLLAQQILYSVDVKRGELINNKPSLRQRYFQAVTKLLPDHANAMLLALSFGYRANISKTQWQQFQAFGISHLIAISGLHVGLMFGFCYVLMKFIFLGLGQVQNVTASLVMSFLFAIFYVWLSGCALPALRALILLALGCVYKLANFKVTLLQLWLLMFMATLVITPSAVYGVSFVLSFGAIASVFIMLWYINENTMISQSTFSYYGKMIFTAVKVQCCLFLLLLPFQITIFSGFSWIAPLANLMLIPFFSFFVLPILLFAVLMTPLIPVISQLLFRFVDNSLQAMSEVLFLFHDQFNPWITLTYWQDNSPKSQLILIVYLFLLLLFMARPAFNYLQYLLIILMSIIYTQNITL